MAIVRVLKRYFGGFVLGLIAAVAYLQVRGATQLRGPAHREGPSSRSSAIPPHEERPASEPSVVASTMPEPVHRPPDVDRSVLEGGGVNALSGVRSVRVVPEQRDGKLVGLRLFGIRPGSLLGTLGLKNGDRLEAINGFGVASPEQALEAYARLRTAKRLNVQLSRLGKPVTIDLNIN